jgi:hypothetical protein
MKLWWAVKDRHSSFPLLYAISAHEEGPEGDFEIQPEQVPSLLGEIDRILSQGETSNDSILNESLGRLRKVAMEAQRRNLIIFGLAD